MRKIQSGYNKKASMQLCVLFDDEYSIGLTSITWRNGVYLKKIPILELLLLAAIFVMYIG